MHTAYAQMEALINPRLNFGRITFQNLEIFAWTISIRQVRPVIKYQIGYNTGSSKCLKICFRSKVSRPIKRYCLSAPFTFTRSLHLVNMLLLTRTDFVDFSSFSFRGKFCWYFYLLYFTWFKKLIKRFPGSDILRLWNIMLGRINDRNDRLWAIY